MHFRAVSKWCVSLPVALGPPRTVNHFSCAVEGNGKSSYVHTWTILFLRLILRRFFPSEVLRRHFKVTELVFLAIYQASRKLLKKRILGETSRLRWSDEDDANISALRFVYNLFHASRLVFRKSKLKSGLNCNFQIPC